MARPQGPPRRSRIARRRHTYKEPDSDSDLSPEPVAVKPRPTRSSRRTQTYREDDTDEEDVSETSSTDSSLDQRLDLATSTSSRSQPTRRRRSQRISRSKIASAATQQTVPRTTLNSFKRQKLAHKIYLQIPQTKDTRKSIPIVPLNTKAPPWQTLEYGILLRIMQYAAYPLFVSTFRSRPSIDWLLGVSRLCKSFHEAAIAALLWEPPLLPSYRAHELLANLTQDQEKLSLNYRTKIRSLNVEAKYLLVRVSSIALEDLLPCTPLLSRLRIFHGNDEMIGKAIWAEPKMSHVKWSYDGLFDVMDRCDIRLKSFEWNGRFQAAVASITTAHEHVCLRGLEHISIVNFSFPEKVEDERVATRHSIIEAISHFPKLKMIEFHNSNILDLNSMPHLPIGLESLNITNCLSLTSEAVESYLLAGGSSLREMFLAGNQVMDLGFMPRLAELCPRLEVLNIDLSYEDSSSYRDRDPLFDTLLPNGIPTWPPSLTSIVIEPLRSLPVSDAEEFYRSLVDAAEDLPYLRILKIKSILKEASWRDRATLRSRWRPVFEKVFGADKTYSPTIIQPKRTTNKEDNKNSSSKKRKSARIKEIEELSISDDVTAADSSDTTTLALLPGFSTLPRQNRCEVVEFDLSDQRPAQEQFREADFLDDEPSGDEEWNGRDEVPSSSRTRNRYAW